MIRGNMYNSIFLEIGSSLLSECNDQFMVTRSRLDAISTEILPVVLSGRFSNWAPIDRVIAEVEVNRRTPFTQSTAVVHLLQHDPSVRSITLFDRTQPKNYRTITVPCVLQAIALQTPALEYIKQRLLRDFLSAQAGAVGVSSAIARVDEALDAYGPEVFVLPTSAITNVASVEPKLVGTFPALDGVVDSEPTDSGLLNTITEFVFAKTNLEDRIVLSLMNNVDTSDLEDSDIETIKINLRTQLNDVIYDHLENVLGTTYDFASFTPARLTSNQEQSLIEYGAAVVGSPSVVLDALGRSSDVLTVSQIQELVGRAVTAVAERGGSDSIVVSEVPRSVTEFVRTVFPTISVSSFASIEAFYMDGSGFALNVPQGTSVPSKTISLLNAIHPALIIDRAPSFLTLTHVGGNDYSFQVDGATVTVTYQDAKQRGADFSSPAEVLPALHAYHALVNTIYSWVFHSDDSIRMSLMAMDHLGVRGVTTGTGFSV